MNISPLIPLSLLLSLGACSKYENPEVQITESYTFYNAGTPKRAFLNEYIPDSVSILVTSQYGSYIPGFEISINVPSGAGEVDNETGVTNSQGLFSTKWKLGPFNNQQILKATVTHSDGRYLGTIDIVAYGFPHEGWSDIPAAPENGMNDMIADTVRHITAALSSGSVYIRGENYFTWIQNLNNQLYNPVSFAQTPDQTFYIATSTGAVYMTKHLDGFWLQCNYPQNKYDYYVRLKATSDNSIWFSSAGTSTWRSRDHGQNWEKDTIGMQAGERVEDVYRLSDGDLLFLSQSGRLYHSDNDGAGWTQRTVPQYTRKLFVTATDEVIVFSMDNGISIYKSTDKGLQFDLKGQYYSGMYSQWNHAVHEYDNTYYVLIQGYGILTTADFETFSLFKADTDAIDMMMDADGNILLRDYQYGQVHYFANSK